MAGGARCRFDRTRDISTSGRVVPETVEGWGRYGLSAFYARSDDEVLDLGEDRLDAFATLYVYRLADVIAAGFEVVPTYRSPHVTITFYDDVDTGVARLLAVSHRIVNNPAFRQEDA